VHNKVCLLGDAQSPHVIKWAKYFHDSGHDVTVLSLRKGNVLGISVFDLNPPKILSKFGYLLSSFKVRRLVRQIRPDILHASHASSYGFLGAFSGFHPLVISVWGSDVLTFPKKSIFHKLLLTWSLSKADLITATSKFLARNTRSLSPKVLKKIEVVPFGVDLEVFNPSRLKIRKTERDTLKIGFFKHLKPKYGPEYLVRAFKKVSDKFGNVELFLAGNGELKSKLKDLTESFGISPKVHFLGFVNNVPKIMSSMDITVMPSVDDSETFGVAAVESQALEVPVVASRIGGVPEVVKDGETGILVKACDEEELFAAITRLLSDEDIRLRMGRAGRKFVRESYNWKENASKMGRFYKKLMISYNIQ